MIDLTHTRFQTASKPRLLLIEDEHSVVESLSLLLKADYDVSSESTVAGGISQFQQMNPALVILDLRLPDGNGLEVLREIRRGDLQTPVIVLTGYSSMRTAEEALRLGASDYLHKPFDGFSLKGRIEELLQAHGAGKSRERQVQRKLDKAQRQIAALKLKADAADIFLHDAASPVITVLTAVHYLCDLVETRHGSDKDAKAMADLLMNSVGFISSLFEQNSYIESLGRLPSSEIELHKVAHLALSLAKQKAETHEIAVGLHLQNPEATIAVNRFALARVLLNLLHNAIEAVPAETGRVTLKVAAVDGFAEFSVIDNGPGIPETLRERIFDCRFSTKTDGSGLGLYISKHLMSGMGGDITLHSELGHGSRFSIKIPLLL